MRTSTQPTTLPATQQTARRQAPGSVVMPELTPSQGISSIIEIDVLSLTRQTYEALAGIFERFPAVMTTDSFKRRTGALRRSSPRFTDFEKLDLSGGNYVALIEKPQNALPNKCAVLLRNDEAWEVIKAGAETALNGGKLKSVQRTKLSSALSSALPFSDLR